MFNVRERVQAAALGNRASGPSRGRRPWPGPGWPFSAGGRYFYACVAALALWGAASLVVVGCNTSFLGSGWPVSKSGVASANVRQSPEEIDRLLRNVHYYKLMGQPELGLRELELVHQQNPDNLQIVNYLAQNYEELGKFEAARQLYQEALARHGAQPALANNLCFSYYQEGRWQEAETCFRQTLARDPVNVAARNNLGLLYCRLGRQDEARQLWQQAEGGPAAEIKVGQALAALGLPKSPVYAQKPVPAPPVAKAAPVARPKAAISRVPASTPVQGKPAAQPVTRKESPGQLAATPAPGKPAPDAARAQKKAQKPPAVAAKTPAAAPPAPVAAAPLPPVVALAPPAAPVAAPAAAPVTGPAVTPAPAPAAPPIHLAPLTCAELVDTAIEIRNGTWTRNLAHATRARLGQEGFNVAKIGNHVDFGAAKTIIYYRPGTERIARALRSSFFPVAGLEPSTKLQKGMDIKILLGADFIQHPPLMAHLANEQ
jgi:Flp pilus assembly protein TadD